MGRRMDYDARGLAFCELPLLDEAFDEEELELAHPHFTVADEVEAIEMVTYH